MKKNYLLILILFALNFNSHSQIAVSSFKKSKERYSKLINSETIFVLPNTYDKDEYDKILKDTWNLTPYQIISSDDFDITNYLDEKYSFFTFRGVKSSSQSKYGGEVTYLYTYGDLTLYDTQSLKKKLAKISSKKLKKKSAEIFNENSFTCARFYLYPKDEFVNTAILKEIDEISYSLYNDDVFFNTKLGFLKNYFEFINIKLKQKEGFLMFDSDYTKSLKGLINNKLYIPSYITINYNGWNGNDSPEYNKETIETLSK